MTKVLFVCHGKRFKCVRCHALLDEGTEVGKRVLPDGEPVIVRMGIYETG